MEDRLAFGPFTYDGPRRTLWRDGVPATLGSRAAALLDALLASKGNVVPSEALIAAGWKGAIVEDSNLAVQIAGLRKALGPRADGSEWVTTVPRLGYRLQVDEPTSVDGKPSLAVLPFLNMSSDPEQEHFADGMVEDLITAFSRFRSFAVAARHSSFVYKNSQFDIRDAARKLDVRYLIEGSVRRSGDVVRVTAQLIEGASGAHLWAANFDGTLGSVFEFQDHITSKVVGLIEPQIRAAEIERAQRKPPENLDAMDLYWRASPLLQTAHGRGYHEAVDLLDQAVALAPHYAPVLAMSAYAHEKRGSRWGSPPQVDDRGLAIALSERAMRADSSDPFVLTTSGIVELTLKGDGARGLTLAHKAYELNPNAVLVCNVASFLHWAQGNFDTAAECALRGMRLSPGTNEVFWSLSAVARAYLSAGRFEDALVWAQRSLEANADQDYMRATIVACLVHLGQVEGAASIQAEMNAKGVTIPDVAFAARSEVNLREGLARAKTLLTA